MDAPLCRLGYEGPRVDRRVEIGAIASRYAHAIVSEEATKAALLPFGESAENGAEKKKA